MTRSDIARQLPGSTAHNTLNMPSVELRFQQAPGNFAKTGIGGLAFRVTADGRVIQAGVTDAEGRLQTLVPGGSARLELLFAGAVAAAYDVTVDPDALAPVTEPAGQQQRLRLLGFQIGRGGPSKDGVTGKATAPTGARQDPKPQDSSLDDEDMKFERGVLEYQADIGRIPGNASIVDKLPTDAGG